MSRTVGGSSFGYRKRHSRSPDRREGAKIEEPGRARDVAPGPAPVGHNPFGGYFSVIVTESIVSFSVGVERSEPVVGTSASASTTSRPSVTLPKIV